MEKNNHKITTIVGILALCWGTLGISVMSWVHTLKSHQVITKEEQVELLIYSVVAISGAILMLKRKKMGQYMLWFMWIDNTLHYDDLSAPYLLPLTLIVIWSLPTFIGKDLE